MSYAEVVFRAFKPDKKGVTEHAMLLQAQRTAEALGLEWKAIEDKEEELTPEEPPPPGSDWIWGVFLELHNGRSGGFGPNPLTWTDIWAWSRLHGIRLEHWEIKTIRLLDYLWMKIVGSKEEDHADSR